MSPNDTHAQHVVTAVIVAHDGATWLPHVINALLGQTRPVQRVVAVDTGSRDRSGSVLAGLLGQSVVFGMERGTGYAAAVVRAVQHRAANVNVPSPPGVPEAERIEWLWLLHDDSEPAPDALEQLLRGAAETRSAAVLGPKVMDWADRQVILEAGVTIDTAGRRITGIEPREVDQGQHDGDRDCLAVGSPGMLVRRDVWEQVGGFDPAMELFREDVDLCWRVHAAGYRVRVVTDAVTYHLEATARRRRTVSVAKRPNRLDRRNALMTLLANLPARPMLAALAGNLAVSTLRMIFFLVAKRPAAALDELAACASVFGHPFRLLTARRRRARGRRAAYGRLRADLPPGRSVRRMAEFAAAAMSKSGQDGTTGSHHASEDPSEDDSMLVDTGLTQRILTHPGVLLFAALTVISLVAGRSLLGTGTIQGGALVPAFGGATGLWHLYVQGFHPTGIGSGTIAPPYIAVIAALATVLGAKPWLAVEVILLGCVPLAGMTAYFAARRITRFALARVWAAASYALLPVAMGSVAAGRIGTAMVFVLLPLVALAAGRIFTQPPKLARRAAWAAGLGVAICAAFVPMVWVAAVAAGGVAAAVLARRHRGMLLNLVIAALVTPVLLIPWTLQVVAHPALLLLEAGQTVPGLANPALPARSLLLLSPGGPGLPTVWITAGIIVTAMAALLLSQRRALVLAGWGVGLFGLLVAIAESRAVVTVPGTGAKLPAWPGAALAVAAIGLVLAAVAGSDVLPALLGGGLRGRDGLLSPRGLGLAALVAVASSAPLLAAASWVTSGVHGPVASVRGQVVPELVAVSSANGLRLRTLVLRTEGDHVSYTVLRGTAPSIGEPDLAPDPAPQRVLAQAVATLIAPNGGDAVNQGSALAQFDIGFVLLPAPSSPALGRLLDGVAGLRPVSAGKTFSLWRLVNTPARVKVVGPDGKTTALPSGPVNVSGAQAPVAGGILELAEPAGSWSATLNGRPLAEVRSPAGSWAQAFRLPAGGGQLSISHDNAVHGALLLAELVILLVVSTLALPGIGSAAASAPTGTRGRDAAGTRAAAAGMPVMAGAGPGDGGPAGGGPVASGPVGSGPDGREMLGGPVSPGSAGSRSRAGGRGRGKGTSARPGRRPKRDRKKAGTAGRRGAADRAAGAAGAASAAGAAGLGSGGLGSGGLTPGGAPGPGAAGDGAPWPGLAAAGLPAPDPAAPQTAQWGNGADTAGQPGGGQPGGGQPETGQTQAWPGQQLGAWPAQQPVSWPASQPGHRSGQSPTSAQPSPSGQQPSPSGQQPSPSGQQPSPSGQYPSPSGQQSSPSGQQTSPSGQYPSPSGQYSSPSGGQGYPPAGQPGYPPGQEPPRGRYPVTGPPAAPAGPAGSAWDSAPSTRSAWDTPPPAGRPAGPPERGLWESASPSGSHPAPPPDRGAWPPGQTNPGQTQPGHPRPGQTQPGQTYPGQTQPGQTRPGQSPQHYQPGPPERPSRARPGRTLSTPSGQWTQPPAMAPSPSAWPSADGNSLDPLPPSGGNGPGWQEPEATDESDTRWPAPSQDYGDDRW